MVTSINTGELQNVTDEARLKALRHDINCVGIALSKCLGQSQKDIVVHLINQGVITAAEDLQLDGSIPKACTHFGWRKLFPKGATWTSTLAQIQVQPRATKFFAVNWGNAGKEGFDQKKIFHAFAIEIGASSNKHGKTTAHVHVKGGNIKDYGGQLKADDWVSAWQVQ